MWLISESITQLCYRQLPCSLVLETKKNYISILWSFSDVRKLARDFKVNDVEKIIENCIDAGVFANSVLPFTKRWSLAALVEYIVGNLIILISIVTINFVSVEYED